jgi:hypothetical protein
MNALDMSNRQVLKDRRVDPPSGRLRERGCGRAETAAPGFALVDAWEMAGSGSGHTWARGNPWAEL